jgi:hypothetical protein
MMRKKKKKPMMSIKRKNMYEKKKNMSMCKNKIKRTPQFSKVQ